ncbi:MAG: NAD-dependent epimerase/dehydratase family protein [Desulfomonilaceae bacterium]
MKQALITGSCGFIGRHVASCFAQFGWDVIGIGHGHWAQNECKSWGIRRWHNGDVTLQNLQQLNFVPNTVVHCAGAGSVATALEEPGESFERTVGTTVHLLEFIRQFAPEAPLILTSSVAVCGDTPVAPISEQTPDNPVSPYGLMKQQAEQLCLMYGKFFGVKSARVRLFSVYGPGLQKQIMWDICQKILRGALHLHGTGSETRDFLHVIDAARLLYEAQRAATMVSPVINGGTGIGTTVGSLVDMIVREFGGPNNSQFSGRHRPGDPAVYVADTFRSLSLGWKPEIDLQVGIKEYVDWFRSANL